MNKILILCLLLTLFFYIFKQRENYQCDFNKSRHLLKLDVRDRNLSKHSPMWDCGNWTEHPRDMEGNIGTYVDYRREQNNLIQHEINRLHSMRSDGNVNRSLDHKRSEVSNNKNKLRNMINDLTKKKNHIQKYYDDLDEKMKILKRKRILKRKNELLEQIF